MTHFHAPAIEFSGQPEISIYTDVEPVAVIHWAAGNEHVDSDAEADEKIGVYLRAKEMLAAHRHAVACHAGIGEYVNGAPERTATPAEHADTAARIERARDAVPLPEPGPWTLKGTGDARATLQAEVDGAVAEARKNGLA